MAYEGALSAKAKASYPKSVVRKRYSTLNDNSGLSSTDQPNLAKIRVVSQIAGREDPLPNPYVGFFLVSVQEDRSEKAEIVPLPGDDYAAFFYGEMPRNIAFTGVLLNTEEDLWRDAFETLYEDHLRGTVSSARGSLVQIKYGERIVSGWLMNFSQSVRADSDLYTQFSFTVLVKSVHMLNLPAASDTLYSRYIAGADASLNQANPAQLNVADLDAAIDKVQTGYVAPPPKPRRGRGSRRSNCVINPDLLSGGGANPNRLIEDPNAFFSQGRCRTTDVINSYVDRGNDLLDQAEKAAARGDTARTNTLLAQAAAVRGTLSTASTEALFEAEISQDVATIAEMPEVSRLSAGGESVGVQYGNSTIFVYRDGRGFLRAAVRSDLTSSFVNHLPTLDVNLRVSRGYSTESAQNRATSAMSNQVQRAARIKAALEEKIAEQQRRQRASTRDARLASASNQ